VAGSTLTDSNHLTVKQPGRPEILAPAGDLFKLKTAMAYGADAVYLAGERFGLRQASDNFLPSELREGCNLVHRLGKKVFVAVNAFLFDHELEELPDFLKLLSELEVDGVIVSDLGVLSLVKKETNLNIHISTQASVLNSASALFWKARGAHRVILGREVSIREADLIRRISGLEVEVFVHGAMCMAYSGHCTISNYTAGRDSNRGGCVQSCRFRYKLLRSDSTSTFLSSKDLRSLKLMPQFLASSIDSLKIEGRNKGPLYLATAVRNYRRAVDLLLDHSEASLDLQYNDLEKLSHRGYTRANLLEPAGPNSIYDLDHVDPPAYEMAGYVIEKKKDDYFSVYTRGNLDSSDFIEIMGKGEQDFKVSCETMRDANAQRITGAKPNTVVFFSDRKGIEEGMILRKRMGAFLC
jgi:putative protease